MKSNKLSCAHALIKHLISQKIIINTKKLPLFAGAFAIYGHGNVACIGQAMEENKEALPAYRGQHEQYMALTALGYARAMRRKQIFVSTSSVGPGSTNMITAAAVALSNRLPILFLPADTFANRFPDPVLQQIENFYQPGETVNDAFKPVSRYFDRITRPEQILQSLPQAINVMLDQADCGPATISLSQDVQGEVFDYPDIFFEEKIHEIRRISPDIEQINKAIQLIKNSKHPIIISGGGVLYSEAEKELSDFASKHNVPVVQTVMGFGSMLKDHPFNIGPVGGLGGKAANDIAKKTDLAIAIGTKLSDFTTGSWSNFENQDFKLICINTTRFDANKHLAQPIVSDAKLAIKKISECLGDWRSNDNWINSAREGYKLWNNYINKKISPTNQELPSYVQVVGAIYKHADPTDIAVTAAGGLVGETLQVWRPRSLNTFETEWGFSCMGYEIAGAMGIKMAKPNQDVIVFCGDGSYLLWNSDIYSSVLYDQKLIIILCDNGGHMVINRLQLAKGGKEYLSNLKAANTKKFVSVDFAQHAKSMGAESENVNSVSELEQAFLRAKKSDKTYLISIKTHGYEWLEGTAYWESPTLQAFSNEENKKAYEDHIKGKDKQRRGV